MTAAYTNPHAAEIAHDVRLLELLSAAHRALHQWDEGKVIAAAVTGYAGSDRFVDVTVDKSTVWSGLRAEELPEGIIYRQSQTWTRGEAGTYVTTGGGKRRATIDDAVNVLGDDHPAVVEYRIRAVEFAAAVEAADAHDDEYTGWQRFYLVTTSSGHIHRSRSCSTCYLTTGYALIPGLSCASEAEAVALVGPNLCTVCFPSAPVSDVGGKVTQALATILVEEGEEAFRAKVAANAAQRCDGSGKAAPADIDRPRYGRTSYATCAGCGKMTSVTTSGKFRAHKP